MRNEPTSAGLRPPSLPVVRNVIVASVVLTAFHFTDNFVSIETYPQPDWITQPVVLISWLIFTGFGFLAYILYRQGHFPLAEVTLILYSYAGLSSLGHFLNGGIDDFTTRGLISVLLDGAVGVTVLALAIWSIAARRGRAKSTITSDS